MTDYAINEEKIRNFLIKLTQATEIFIDHYKNFDPVEPEKFLSAVKSDILCYVSGEIEYGDLSE